MPLRNTWKEATFLLGQKKKDFFKGTIYLKYKTILPFIEFGLHIHKIQVIKHRLTYPSFLKENLLSKIWVTLIHWYHVIADVIFFHVQGHIHNRSSEKLSLHSSAFCFLLPVTGKWTNTTSSNKPWGNTTLCLRLLWSYYRAFNAGFLPWLLGVNHFHSCHYRHTSLKRHTDKYTNTKECHWEESLPYHGDLKQRLTIFKEINNLFNSM